MCTLNMIARQHKTILTKSKAPPFYIFGRSHGQYTKQIVGIVQKQR